MRFRCEFEPNGSLAVTVVRLALSCTLSKLSVWWQHVQRMAIKFHMTLLVYSALLQVAIQMLSQAINHR